MDKKIRREDRQHPLLCDGSEVLLAPGVAMSQELDAAQCETVWSICWEREVGLS